MTQPPTPSFEYL